MKNWSDQFKSDGGGQVYKEYRIGKEKLSITKNGLLQIKWPSVVDQRKQKEIDKLDFLIACSTKPKHKDNNIKKYPTLNEICKSIKTDKERFYFINNYMKNICTFQDMKIINNLETL